jgi:CubicO group peptidase (beta-lactamase class C family)
MERRQFIKSAATSDLQARLAEAIAKHKVMGASAAVFRNGAVETAAAGLINVATGVEMTTDTVMHIGSITKVFTATLVWVFDPDAGGKMRLLNTGVSAYRRVS